MEEAPKTEKVISPEKFFEKNIEIHKVSKEEFLSMIKKREPGMNDEEILQMKGVGFFGKDDKAEILIRTDIFPEQYMPYLETHEKWEAYITKKKGFNLWDRSVRKYSEDKGIDNFTEEDKEKFYKNIGQYNYDFRHEYAVYKEYEQAMKDGKLDEYYDWFMKLREEEKLNTKNENILNLIKNDTEIRKSIYKKLKEGDAHIFLRN